MPKIKYADIKLGNDKLVKIERANAIIDEYIERSLDLTLRQLYYQFVARAMIPNNDKEYKKLGDAISDGRMAGLIDWDRIVDRTRFIRRQAHWGGPEDIVSACAEQFRLDKWDDQPNYVEVFIEKDALIGVIEGVCTSHDVPYLACRGYNSMSEIWRAGQRHKERRRAGKRCSVLYLGDHDPSGIDMTRDVQARLDTFVGGGEVTVTRLALNMDQVEEYTPPPNPTKLSDSRAADYVETYGEECWELDALDPTVIVDLVREAILERRVKSVWDRSVRDENRAKARLKAVSDHWDAVATYAEGL